MRYLGPVTSVEAALRDLESKNIRVRVEAAEALGQVEEQDRGLVSAALRPLLSDSNPDVRYMAARSLGRLGDVEAIDQLVAVVRDDPEPMPRQSAAAALGEIGDPRATPVLIEALGSSAPELRFQAATSLSRVAPEDDPIVAEELQKATGDEDAEVRAGATAALGDLGHQGSRDLLTTLSDDDPDERVRMEAAAALARMGDRRGTPTLTKLLDHRDFSLLAAEYLYLCPDPSAREALRSALARWLTPALLKVWAAAALARLGEEEGRQRLLELVRHRKEPVRGLAIQVLGDIDQPWSLNILKTLIEPAENQEFGRWREEILEALNRHQG